jgi:processing peptidase subunit beta
LNAYTSREQTVFYAKCFKKDVPQAIDILADILQNSNFDEAAVTAERDTILREMESVNENFEEVIFDKLHETAFRGTALGRTILGPEENIQRITSNDLKDYLKTHYVGSRMVVAAAGAVDHAEIVRLSEKLFNKIPAIAPEKQAYMEPAVFDGSDIKMIFDNMNWCWWAMAYPTCGWNDPDSIPLMLMQTMLGGYDRSTTGGTGAHSTSRLVAEAAGEDLVEKFSTFNTQYSDSGLFGVYAQIQPMRTEHFTLLAQSQMVQFAYWVDEQLLAEAKTQLKMNLLAHLRSSFAPS